MTAAARVRGLGTSKAHRDNGNTHAVLSLIKQIRAVTGAFCFVIVKRNNYYHTLSYCSIRALNFWYKRLFKIRLRGKPGGNYKRIINIAQYSDRKIELPQGRIIKRLIKITWNDILHNMGAQTSQSCPFEKKPTMFTDAQMACKTGKM